MGQRMLDEGITADEVDQLYDAAGRLTPAGHQHYADAIFACFYAGSGGRTCLDE
jgi:hypothetical protein